MHFCKLPRSPNVTSSLLSHGLAYMQLIYCQKCQTFFLASVHIGHVSKWTGATLIKQNKILNLKLRAKLWPRALLRPTTDATNDNQPRHMEEWSNGLRSQNYPSYKNIFPCIKPSASFSFLTILTQPIKEKDFYSKGTSIYEYQCLFAVIKNYEIQQYKQTLGK